MPITLDTGDLIAAIAGPPGPGVRGLIRLSGPGAVEAARVGFCDETISAATGKPEARRGRLEVQGFGRPIAATIVVWPGERTYTGGPLAEVHLIGSGPILRAVLAHYLANGARLAEPGEFTLRAFLAGRIDLTQAEAVLGVIDAANPAGLDAALAQLAGGLAGPIRSCRDLALDLLAHLEANLDFSEEPDVDPLGREALASNLDDLAARVESAAQNLRGRDLAGERPKVVLVGLPNAGKSRLFNALLGADRAIVSPLAGTTRDYLTSPLDADGLLVDLVDTAGFDVASDPIEGRAQAFRSEQAEAADLKLVCVGPGDLPPARSEIAGPALIVATKSDLTDNLPPLADLATSATLGTGLDRLRLAIADHFRTQSADSDPLAATASRCGDSLRRASTSLRSASETIRLGLGDDFVAVDLRQAVDDLGRVVGEVVTDDILERIFRRFCVGK